MEIGKNNLEKEKVEEKKAPESMQRPPTNENKPYSKPDRREREERKRFRSNLQKTTIKIWRPVKVTKGGRQFSFTSLILIKDKEKGSVA